MTVAHIYNEEFGGNTARTDTTFIALLNKLVLNNLGSLPEEGKKVRTSGFKKMFFLM